MERMTCNFLPSLTYLNQNIQMMNWEMDVLSERQVLCQQHHTHASWCSCERASKIDVEKKKLLKEVVIFVFFAYKKYSSSFIKLWLNQWCHMDYFNNVLTTFLGLERVRCVAETHTHTHTHTQGQKSLGFHQKYHNLCSEDERRSRFGTT